MNGMMARCGGRWHEGQGAGPRTNAAMLHGHRAQVRHQLGLLVHKLQARGGRRLAAWEVVRLEGARHAKVEVQHGGIRGRAAKEIEEVLADHLDLCAAQQSLTELAHCQPTADSPTSSYT